MGQNGPIGINKTTPDDRLSSVKAKGELVVGSLLVITGKRCHGLIYNNNMEPDQR
jgi:hypothetical protein